MKRTRDREKIVADWMASIVEKGRLETYDDLHIDRIDLEWKDRKLWLVAAAEAFRIAIAIREKRLDAVDVALAFSLNSGENARGANFHDGATFQSELD